MSKSTSKTVSAAASAAAAMTTPAQLERLGEHLIKLRLLKSSERLEALLQHAAAHELPYAEFLEQVLGEEVAAKASKNIAMRTAMARFPFVKPLETFDFAYQPSIDSKLVQQLAGFQVPPNRPIIGDWLYYIESGIVSMFHRRCKVVEPLEYIPFAPGMVGRPGVDIALGKGSGLANVEEHLERRAISVTPEQADAIASVGMYEHVGHRRLPDYCRAVFRALRPGGLFLNHGITLPVGEQARTGGRSDSQILVAKFLVDQGLQAADVVAVTGDAGDRAGRFADLAKCSTLLQVTGLHDHVASGRRFGGQKLHRVDERLLVGRAPYPDELVTTEEADGIDLIEQPARRLRQLADIEFQDGKGIIQRHAAARGQPLR